jgi:Zn ribbon nucleic-acid-binding protein
MSKEEYEKRFSEFTFTRANIEKERKSLADLSLRYPHKNFYGYNATNSVGDYIRNVKNVHVVFQANDSENLRYSQDAPFSQDSVDVTEAWAELSYEVEGMDGKSCIAGTKSVALFDSYYSELCSNSHDLFGCVGLKKSEYALFNRRYGKEEYHQLRDKIIAHMRQTGEWGNFFPAVPSLFAYNESTAQDYFPLTEKEALARGMKWYHRTDRDYKITLRPAEIPETIQKTDDAVLEETVGCISQEDFVLRKKYLNCATAFRILPAELDLYRKMGIPIPEKCPQCRKQDRMQMRNPRKLWNRQCQCAGIRSKNGTYQNIGDHTHGGGHCSNTFDTSYALDRPEIIYCEPCYQAEVQ